MSKTATKQKLQLRSRPHSRRVGLIPVSVVCVFAWILALSSLAVSISSFVNMVTVWSVPLVLLSAAFTTYMGFFTYWLIKDSQQEFVLELTDDTVTLSGYDKAENKRRTKSMAISDIESAEYYPTRDVANVLLRGQHGELDIPLWSFGPRGKVVVDFLRSKDIKVVTVGM